MLNYIKSIQIHTEIVAQTAKFVKTSKKLNVVSETEKI